MLVASGGVLIFRKDFIAIYLIYIVNNSKRQMDMTNQEGSQGQSSPNI
jgi:hypothetical protein